MISRLLCRRGVWARVVGTDPVAQTGAEDDRSLVAVELARDVGGESAAGGDAAAALPSGELGAVDIQQQSVRLPATDDRF